MAGDCTGECREDSLLFARLNRRQKKNLVNISASEVPSPALGGAYVEERSTRWCPGLTASVFAQHQEGGPPVVELESFLTEKRGDVAEGARFLVRSLQATVSPHPPESAVVV